MSNMTTPGKRATQSAIDDTVPVAGAGINLRPFGGHSKTDRWMITTWIVPETPTNAELDLGTLAAGNLDTVVEPLTFEAGDGNQIMVAAVGDSPEDGGVTIEEDLDNLIVTIHFESTVSTVLDVETAITANSTLIAVKTAGTPATVLDVATDEFEAEPLAGGVDSTEAYNVVLWGRDGTTRLWARHNDAYGTIVNGVLGSNVEGRQTYFVRDLGNYDRLAFTREDETPTDVVNATVSEILMSGRGN